MKIRPVGAELFLVDRRTDMTNLILRKRLKIKRHVDEMYSIVQRIKASLWFKRRTQTASRPDAHILVVDQRPTTCEEAAGYGQTTWRTVTGISRTDNQRVLDASHKCEQQACNVARDYMDGL